MKKQSITLDDISYDYYVHEQGVSLKLSIGALAELDRRFQTVNSTELIEKDLIYKYPSKTAVIITMVEPGASTPYEIKTQLHTIVQFSTIVKLVYDTAFWLQSKFCYVDVQHRLSVTRISSYIYREVFREILVTEGRLKQYLAKREAQDEEYFSNFVRNF